MTGAEYGYVLADAASVGCFVLLTMVFLGTLLYYKYEPDWLLHVGINKSRFVDLLIFIIFLVGYVYVVSIYGEQLFSTRFAPVWVSLPILIAAGILELRWKKDVEVNSKLGD